MEIVGSLVFVPVSFCQHSNTRAVLSHGILSRQLDFKRQHMAVIDSKGRITLPASVRTVLGVRAGDRVMFVPLENGRFELVASILPVTALKGSIAKPKRPVSIDDINAAIARRGSAQSTK